MCRPPPAPRSQGRSACRGAGQCRRGSVSLCHSRCAAQSLRRGASRCRPRFAVRHRGSSVPRSLSSSASWCRPTSASRCPGRSVDMASELLFPCLHLVRFLNSLSRVGSENLVSSFSAPFAARTQLQLLPKIFIAPSSEIFKYISNIPSPLTTSRGEIPPTKNLFSLKQFSNYWVDTIESWSAFFSREHQMRLLQLIDKSWTMLVLAAPQNPFTRRL